MDTIELAETDEQKAERIAKWRLSRALADAPALLAHVRGMAISGAIDRGEVLREQTAPVRLRPLSDADSVYAQLIDWVMDIASQLQLSPPSSQVLAWNLMDPDAAWDDYRGFRAGTTPSAANLLTSIQTLWLVGHMTQIEAWAGYQSFRDDVTDKLWRLRSRYPMQARRERSTSDRECPACGQEAVSADWWSEEMREVDVSCQACGLKIEADVKVRIGNKRVGVLDLLDWETRENRDCTCRYPGDPDSDCPVHHPDGPDTMGAWPSDTRTLPSPSRPSECSQPRSEANTSLRSTGLTSETASSRKPSRSVVHVPATTADFEHESDLKPGEVVCQSCFIVKPCPCEDGQ